MGKPTTKPKNKKPVVGKSSGARSNKSVIDDDNSIFIAIAQEVKDEGNTLYQKREFEGAMLKYEKAIKLLPSNHADVSTLRSNMAACYMQMGIGHYPRAIRECNSALKLSPNYTKALLRRAQCYEGLNKLQLAFTDVNVVLELDPENSTALEVMERLRKEADKLGINLEEKEIDLGVSSLKPSPVKSEMTKQQKKGSGGKSMESAVDNVKVDTAVVVEEGVVENVVMENGDSEKADKRPTLVDVKDNELVVDTKEKEVKVVVEQENVTAIDDALKKNNEAMANEVKLGPGVNLDDKGLKSPVKSRKVRRHRKGKGGKSMESDVKNGKDDTAVVVDNGVVETVVLENGDAEKANKSHKLVDVKETELLVVKKEDEVKVVVEKENVSAIDDASKKKRHAVKKDVKLALGVNLDDKETDLEVSSLKSPPIKSQKAKRQRRGRGGKSMESADKNGKVDTAVVVDKGVVENAVLENGDAEKDNKSHKLVDVKEAEVKVVVKQENVTAIGDASKKKREAVTKEVKLALGDDIRCAHYPLHSSVRVLRDIVQDRFPHMKGILIKYKDLEGDLVTITTTEELRLAESLAYSRGSFRLYITEVIPDQEPVYDRNVVQIENSEFQNPRVSEAAKAVSGPCIDDWMVHFAQLFKNHVGLDADTYTDFHEVAMKVYAEALEDAVTTEDAQKLFEIAAERFQEMAALAMFNWGNVHMSRARKWQPVSEDGSRESVLEHIKASYDWAQKEYKKAAQRYEEAISIKPNFYEGYLALGHQQFEQAKLAWSYAVANKVELETGPSSDVILLYNKAEDSMERGILMWEELEERRLNGISKYDEDKIQLQKMGLDELINDVSPSKTAEQAASMKSQIYILWGTLLYERSIVEYKLNIPVWEECLEVAVEKFELAGVSSSDISVVIKNHISNKTSMEGLWFKIDDIVQAWNEIYVGKKGHVDLASFRLEPLLQRRIPRLHEVLEKV